MRFATFIAERLDKRGTQSDLAKELNISRSTITAWRQGAKPAFEICLQLAEHFGLHPSQIFSMIGDDSYRQIYQRFVEKNKGSLAIGGGDSESPQQAVGADADGTSPVSQEHAELHDKLQRVMESGSEEAEAIATMIEMTHGHLVRREEGPPTSVQGNIKSVYRRQKGETAKVIREKLHNKRKQARVGGLGTGVIPQES